MCQGNWTVFGRDEEQREAERTERQGPLNQVGWCQMALTPEGAQVGTLVVGIQLATGWTDEQGQAGYVRE